jgi:rubrerythrin
MSTPSAAMANATPMATPMLKAKKKMKKKAMKTVWVCPMGDYTGDKPGKCPNCQMDLVKKEVPADAVAAPAVGTKAN